LRAIAEAMARAGMWEQALRKHQPSRREQKQSKGHGSGQRP
jgi:hypothetical protein